MFLLAERPQELQLTMLGPGVLFWGRGGGGEVYLGCYGEDRKMYMRKCILGK